MPGIGIHVAAENEGLGTKAERHFHGHGRVYAIAPGFIATGGYNASATHAANDEGFAFEAAVTEAFYRDKERIEIEMKDCAIVHSSNIGQILTNFKSRRKFRLRQRLRLRRR